MRTSIERALSNDGNVVTCDPRESMEEETKPATILPQIPVTKSSLKHHSGSILAGAQNPRRLDSAAH